MKRFVLLLAAAALLLAGTGCSRGSGVAPVVTLGGTEILVGESRPYDLTSQGFETTFPGGYLTIGEMPPNTWLSSFMSVSKDDGTHAYLYIYNPNSEKKFYSSATIYKVSFQLGEEKPGYWTDDTPLVNGIDFSGMDGPAIKEIMADYKLAHETDWGSLRFEDGPYKYVFSMDTETGELTEIRVEMTIAKSYTEAK